MRFDPRREHDQPVDPDGDAGAVGQAVFHGGQQAVIHRNLREASISSGAEIGLETAPLFGRIGEFVIAVGELEAIDPGLESLGDGWVAGSDSGQRRLGRREVVDKGRAAPAELGLDDVAQQQLEPASRGRRRDRGSMSSRRVRARAASSGRGVGVDRCRRGVETPRRR